MNSFFSDMKDFSIEVLLPCMTIFLIIAAIVIFINQSVSMYQCSSFESVTGKETKYKFFDSCYVDFNGELMRYDEYTQIRKDIYINQGPSK